MPGHFMKITIMAALWVGLSAMSVRAAEPAAGTVWTDPSSGIAFLWIPGGGFEMGCQLDTEHCPDTEKPVHHRTIKGFWLSRTLITQEQWQKLMAVNPSKNKKGGNYPVDQVTWEDAHAFIGQLNQKGGGTFRLPSEAEWEYACRAGNSSDPYCGGTDPQAVAWGIKNSNRSSQPVALKAANAFGLFDMSGNLSEWTADCWSENYADASSDGRPRIDAACESRVLRGGSWGNYPSVLRVSARRSDSDVKCPYIGLRLARDAVMTGERK